MAKFFDFNFCFKQLFKDIRSTMQKTPPFLELVREALFFGWFCSHFTFLKRPISSLTFRFKARSMFIHELLMCQASQQLPSF